MVTHILKTRTINGVLYVHVPKHIAKMEHIEGEELVMASISKIKAVDL